MKDLPEFTQLDHDESRKLAFDKFVRRQKVCQLEMSYFGLTGF